MNFEEQDWNAAILEDLSPTLNRDNSSTMDSRPSTAAGSVEGHQRPNTHPTTQPLSPRRRASKRSKKHQRRKSSGGSQQQQVKIQQRQERKWGTYSIVRTSASRERFLCIAKLKQKHASGPFKLKLARAILSYVQREIREIRDDPEALPDHCIQIEEHGGRGGPVTVVLKMDVLEELLPRFNKLKASKASNRAIAKQLEADVIVRFQDPGEYPLNSRAVKPPITLEVLHRLVPRKADKHMRQFFKDQWSKNKDNFYQLAPLLELICSQGRVYRSSDPRSGALSHRGQKQESHRGSSKADTDKIDYDIILRLNSGARCRLEKRFTGPKRAGMELRVAKGTKLEFFWFHLFEWFHDIRISTKYRRRIFTQIPEALFRVIIGYVVDEPNPDISGDVSSWFSRSLVICKMNENKKAGKGGWNSLHKNSGKHSYSRTILKTQKNNFFALKKRFGLKELGDKAVETLFLSFQDYQPKHHLDD